MMYLESAYIERHEHFIKNIILSGIVWNLKAIYGWCVSPSIADNKCTVMPFWSDRDYAALCAREEWSDYAPTEIGQDAFLEQWLSDLGNDVVLAGTGWDVILCGKDNRPHILKRDFINGRAKSREGDQ